MSDVAAYATRDDKEKWLMRPLNWAMHVVLFSFIFGAFFWFEGKIDSSALAIGLVVSMGVASGLLFWAVRRILNAARGRK